MELQTTSCKVLAVDRILQIEELNYLIQHNLFFFLQGTISICLPWPLIIQIKSILFLFFITHLVQILIYMPQTSLDVSA